MASTAWLLVSSADPSCAGGLVVMILDCHFAGPGSARPLPSYVSWQCNETKSVQFMLKQLMNPCNSLHLSSNSSK